MAEQALHILFAAAEFEPLVKVGGLGEAAAGLVGALRRRGVRVDVVIPDYGTVRLLGQHEETLDVPGWAAPARARTGRVTGVGEITLVHVPGMDRPHAYADPDTGRAWTDNDCRFLAFSAAVAALAAQRHPDVVHLNDWHTAAATAFLPQGQRSLLGIHNLAYQGQADRGWLDRLGPQSWAFDQFDQANFLAGAIRLADRIVAVSPGYAREILSDKHGAGLQSLLIERGNALVGIRNGLDTETWDPAHNASLPATFTASNLAGKELCRKYLLQRTTIDADDGPLIGFVGRFVDQKGVDLVLELARYLDRLPARLVLIGEGEADLVAKAARVAAEHYDRMFYFARFQPDLAQLLVAGSDLLLMPSRFEPCGLVQMQAMSYGAIPVATAVGGLSDTIVDADLCSSLGTGFLAAEATVVDLLDAVHRALRAWNDRRRRTAICRRGMRSDWSWAKPAGQYHDLYRSMML